MIDEDSENEANE